MKDILRIYVLWAPGSNESTRIADLISKHFDGLGMERDGVSFRVPVRFRSEPWEVSGSLPRRINLNEAKSNCIVFLHDDYTHTDAIHWNEYVSFVRREIASRGGVDVYVPFGSPAGEPPLGSDGEAGTQYARRDVWQSALADSESRDARLLLHLIYKIRQHFRRLSGETRHEPLFVSHAKVDGDPTAQQIVNYVNSTTNDVPLQTFYDAKELSPGDDFKQVFLDNIEHGTLLAVVSDAYDSRPWCILELTSAKRSGRPVLLADVGRVRVSRTYPYGANLPKVRVKVESSKTAWIEQLLVEALSEGLRCDLFNAQAKEQLSAFGPADALILPRPPELFDLIDRVSLGSVIVYPDPPLGLLETEILLKATDRIAPTLKLKTLSEIR